MDYLLYHAPCANTIDAKKENIDWLCWCYWWCMGKRCHKCCGMWIWYIYIYFVTNVKIWQWQYHTDISFDCLFRGWLSGVTGTICQGLQINCPSCSCNISQYNTMWRCKLFWMWYISISAGSFEIQSSGCTYSNGCYRLECYNNWFEKRWKC